MGKKKTKHACLSLKVHYLQSITSDQVYDSDEGINGPQQK